jgi:hypothetical protein
MGRLRTIPADLVGLVARVAALEGGSSGGVVVIDRQDLTGSSITFADIPGSFDELLLAVNGRGDAAVNEIDLTLKVNGDTGGTYHRQDLGAFDGSAVSTAESNDPYVGLLPGSSATAGCWAFNRIRIPGYASAAADKPFDNEFMWARTLGATGIYRRIMTRIVAGTGALTDPVTDLLLAPASGNFAAGFAVLYGVGVS